MILMKKMFLPIAVIALLLTAPSATRAQKETPPKGGTPKDFVLPDKKAETLPNGMRSTLIQYGQIPKVTIQLIIKTGNVNEAANEIWLSDLMGNLMEEGTTTLSAGEIARKAAAMGGEISIAVGADQLFIRGTALSQYAPALIGLMADIVQHPAFPEKELPRLKADMKRRLVLSRGIPQSIAGEKFSQLIYGDSPYGRIYPTAAMIEGYTPEQIKKFYHDNIGAKRSVLYVAGKFDEEMVRKEISISFSPWKPGPAASYPPINGTYTPSTAIIDRKGAPQTTIIMGLPAITPKNPDFLPLSITNALLGGSFASRITSNIRENKGYTYSPSSSFNIHPGGAYWAENADVTSEHTIDALKEIKKEILRLAGEAPAAAELDGIKKYNAGIFVLQNSTPSGIISQLNTLDLYGLDDSYLTNRVKNIYAVTPEQVSALTKKYLIPEKMSLVMVGDEQAIKEQQAKAK